MANVSQAFGIVLFLFHYPIPVTVFVYCYGRIFLTVRRQSKVVSGHAGRSQDVPMATASRDPNDGPVEQQATGATTGPKLSRTEMNVLKTMIAVVVCFMVCWSVPAITNLQHLIGVSMYTITINSYILLPVFIWIVDFWSVCITGVLNRYHLVDYILFSSKARY